MTVQIKLDTNALVTLFPEGSEARLELQQAVLQEAARRMLKGLTEQELISLIRPVVERTVAEVKEEWGTFKKDTWKYTFTPSREIRDGIRQAVNEELASFSVSSLNKALEETPLETRLKRLVDDAVRVAASKASATINKSYEEYFQARLAQLNQAFLKGQTE